MKIKGNGNVIGNNNSVTNNLHNEDHKEPDEEQNQSLEFNEELKKLRDVQERRKKAKIFCYNCNAETKQETLFEKGELAKPLELISFDNTGQYSGSVWTIHGTIWKISRCKGCEYINLNVYHRYNPFEDDVLIHSFPKKAFRPFPDWVKHLNKDYISLFGELYTALNNGAVRLGLMGARTLLDLFIIDKIGDVGTFQQKLQKLVTEKYISEDSKELLQIALEYGNAAVHRGLQPNDEQTNGVIDIIEHLLRVEALKNSTKELRNNIPKRKK